MVEKLKIVVEDGNHQFLSTNAITVLYNPNQLVIQKQGWQVQAGSDPVEDKTPATLTMDLFFDTTLSVNETSGRLLDVPDVGLSLLSGPAASRPTDVRRYTDKIASLTNAIAALERPPLCQLFWGGEKTLGSFQATQFFQGLLQQVTKTFTHFSAQGVPVRAQLNCTFVEWKHPDQAQKERNPIDDPVRIVKQGETLSSIAREEYGDATLWRVIADENHLVNPRQIEIGRQITVPPLPRQGGRRS